MFGLSESTYNNIMNIVSNNPKYKFKIFGSRARGDYKKNSDIDIAIFENISKKDEIKIMNEFDLLDIIYMIDLVFVNEKTNKNLLNSIKNEGVDLY